MRFAPSPTGLLHVGNARTALYNYIFARQTGGTLILRIEDTDVERSNARFETEIMKDLRWLGLEWDEGPAEAGVEGSKPRGDRGPYRQSERQYIYANCAKKLLSSGNAYRCFCTQEDLERERRMQAAQNLPQIYSGHCRELEPRTIKRYLDAGKPYTVRLKIGKESLGFHDMVRGRVEFTPEVVSDPILVRSGTESSPGVPVYNYLVTVDDAQMGITHVIRADDHLSNTPKQVAIYRAFGWKVPEFAHLATILGPDRERLSKRHGPTSIAAFREMGYLPEGLLNHLAVLGWEAEGRKTERLSMADLIEQFRIEQVTPSPAVFDFDKLNRVNRHWIQTTSPARLTAMAWEYFGGLLPEKSQTSDDFLIWFARMVSLFAASVDHLDQLTAKALFIWGFDPEVARRKDENAAIMHADSARTVLAELATRLRPHHDQVTAEVFKNWMDEIKEATGLDGKDLFGPVRIALTGTHSGPEFDKLIPIIEEGAALRTGIATVRQRVERFVGV